MMINQFVLIVIITGLFFVNLASFLVENNYAYATDEYDVIIPISLNYFEI